MAKVSRFIRELGRRRVVRTVIAYVVILWALSQGAADLFPAFGLPEWSLRAFIIGGVAAIPLVALLSWRFDITPKGIVSDPFGDPGVFPKVNTTVRNLDLDKEVTFTDLHIHCILVHGFYEGKGSSFRLDPELLIQVLEIEKTEEGISIPGLPE